MQRNRMNVKLDRLLDLYSQSAFLILNKRLIKCYGLEKAVFLSNLVDKLKYFREQGKDKDGWFFQSHEKQAEETGLSEYAIKKAKKKLREDGVIGTRMVGQPAKEHYFIDMAQLERILDGEESQGINSDGLDPSNSKGLNGADSDGLDPIDSKGHNNNKVNNNKGKENRDNLLSEDRSSDDENDSKSTDGNSPQERAKQYLPQSETLANIIRSTKNIKIDQSKLKAWANEIRKLVETDGVDPSRIDSVLSWYSENIGGEYIPVVESGATLRTKFIKLEEAIRRGNGNGSGNKGKRKPRQAIDAPSSKQYPC